MKYLIVLFVSLLFLSCNNDTSVNPVNPPQQIPDVRLEYASIHNWIFGWGVDYYVKLKNYGEATANNVSLKLKYRSTNQTFYYYDSTYVFWGKSIIPTQIADTTVSYALPTGYIVDTLWISILTQ